MSAPGRSLTNCSASAETTRSSEPSRNGSASSSATTARPSRGKRVGRDQRADVLPVRERARAMRPSACQDRPRRQTRAAPRRAARRDRRRHGRAGMSQARARARGACGRAAACGRRRWGGTTFSLRLIPAEAGIQFLLTTADLAQHWVPAFAGTSGKVPCRHGHHRDSGAIPLRASRARPARHAAARAQRRAAAALPRLPHARQRQRPVRRVLEQARLHRAALLSAARHSVRLRPRPRHPVDAGDRRPAVLSSRPRGRALRRRRAPARACVQIRRPARPRADARPLDGARRHGTHGGSRCAGAGTAALAQALAAALQPVGGARQGNLRREPAFRSRIRCSSA